MSTKAPSRLFPKSFASLLPGWHQVGDGPGFCRDAKMQDFTQCIYHNDEAGFNGGIATCAVLCKLHPPCGAAALCSPADGCPVDPPHVEQCYIYYSYGEGPTSIDLCPVPADPNLPANYFTSDGKLGELPAVEAQNGGRNGIVCVGPSQPTAAPRTPGPSAAPQSGWHQLDPESQPGQPAGSCRVGGAKSAYGRCKGLTPNTAAGCEAVCAALGCSGASFRPSGASAGGGECYPICDPANRALWNSMAPGSGISQCTQGWIPNYGVSVSGQRCNMSGAGAPLGAVDSIDVSASEYQCWVPRVAAPTAPPTAAPARPAPPAPPPVVVVADDDNVSSSSAPAALAAVIAVFAVLVLLSYLAWRSSRRRRHHCRHHSIGQDEADGDRSLLGIVSQSMTAVVQDSSSTANYTLHADPVTDADAMIDDTSIIEKEEIGRGGFGTVWKALGPNGELLAVKRVHLGAGDASREARREYEVMRRLQHPNIVPVYALLGGCGDEDFRIVMEFMAGGSVATMVADFGPLRATACANYIAQALAGLEHLHRRGVVHSDVKPANLLVQANGALKLCDFGLARRAVEVQARRQGSIHPGATMQSSRQGSVHPGHLQATFNQANNKIPAADGVTYAILTTAGGGGNNPVGTLPYMSPRVLTQLQYTAQSDLWALGCTLHEMVTAAPPWVDQGWGADPVKWSNGIASAGTTGLRPSVCAPAEMMTDASALMSSADARSPTSESGRRMVHSQRSTSYRSSDAGAGACDSPDAAGRIPHALRAFAAKCFDAEGAEGIARHTAAVLMRDPFILSRDRSSGKIRKPGSHPAGGGSPGRSVLTPQPPPGSPARTSPQRSSGPRPNRRGQSISHSKRHDTVTPDLKVAE